MIKKRKNPFIIQSLNKNSSLESLKSHLVINIIGYAIRNPRASVFNRFKFPKFKEATRLSVKRATTRAYNACKRPIFLSISFSISYLRV
ncbi:MAG: hypothetical protein ACE5J5_03945 [Candidatus Hydrothermarchaeales archaeon]